MAQILLTRTDSFNGADLSILRRRPAEIHPDSPCFRREKADACRESAGVRRILFVDVNKTR